MDIINSHRQTRKSNYHSQTETTKYVKVSVAVTRLFFSDKFIQRTEQTIIIVFFLKKKEKQTQWVLSFGPWMIFDQVIDFFFLLYAGPQNRQTISSEVFLFFLLLSFVSLHFSVPFYVEFINS